MFPDPGHFFFGPSVTRIGDTVGNTVGNPVGNTVGNPVGNTPPMFPDPGHFFPQEFILGSQ